MTLGGPCAVKRGREGKTHWPWQSMNNFAVTVFPPLPTILGPKASFHPLRITNCGFDSCRDSRSRNFTSSQFPSLTSKYHPDDARQDPSRHLPKKITKQKQKLDPPHPRPLTLTLTYIHPQPESYRVFFTPTQMVVSRHVSVSPARRQISGPRLPMAPSF